MLEICRANDNLCLLSWPADALKICIHLLSLNSDTPKQQQQFKVALSLKSYGDDRRCEESV